MRNKIPLTSLNKVPIQILGATGLVGQKLIELLIDHPFFEIDVLSASQHSAGCKLKDVNPAFLHQSIGEKIIQTCEPTTCEVVFSALDATVAKELEETFIREGKWVFSNASAHRLTKGNLLLIPEMKGNAFEGIDLHQPFIVTNPNCCVSGIALSLFPIARKFPIKKISIVTQQAISGAGFTGLPSYDILNNIRTWIPQEEEKIEKELHALFPYEWDLFVTCTRVPVTNGHMAHIEIIFDQAISPEELSYQIEKFSFELPLPSAHVKPLQILSERSVFHHHHLRKNFSPMQVIISSLQLKGNVLRYSLYVDNLIRGAAGICLLNAELWHYTVNIKAYANACHSLSH